MGFARDIGGALISPLGAAMGVFDKKKTPTTPQPMMINSMSTPRRAPTSMIGPTRMGGY